MACQEKGTEFGKKSNKKEGWGKPRRLRN